MAGPEIRVSFDSEGAAKVKRELNATDEQLAKLDKQLNRLHEKKLFEELKKRSKAWQEALKENEEEIGRITSALNKAKAAASGLGSAANKFNEIWQAAGNLAGSAQALAGMAGELAQTGAVARDVADAFEKLGASAPSMEKLRDATAGVIDDTSLQQFAKLASEVGLSSSEIEGLAQRATVLAAEHGKLAQVGEILNKMIKGEAEGLRELGIVVDMSSTALEGLTESEKKLAIAQDQAALGNQRLVDELDSAQASVLRQQAAWENLKSDAAAAFSEFLEGSGILETMADAIRGLSDWMKENRETVERLGNAVSSIFNAAMSIAGKLAENLTFTLELLAPALELAAKGVELFADALSWNLGEAVTQTLITDIPFATNRLGDFNAKIQETLDLYNEAKRLAGEQAAAQSENQRMAAKAREHGERLKELAEAYNGNLDMAASAWVNQNRNMDNALDKLQDMRADLEDHVALVESQSSEERDWGAGALAALNQARIADIERLERAILDQQSEEQEGIRDLEEQKKAAEEAEKKREERRKKREEDRKRLQEVRFAVFDEAFQAEMALLDDIIEAEEHALDIEQRRLEVAHGMLAGMASMIEKGMEAAQGDAWGTGGLLASMLGAKPEEVPTLLEGIAASFNQVADSAEAAWRSVGDSQRSVEDWGNKAQVATKVGAELAMAFHKSSDASTRVDAGIAASGQLVQAFVEDAVTEASLMALVEGARAASAYAIGNIPGGIAHTAAAASWIAAAAFNSAGNVRAEPGSGGGGGGRAGSSTSSMNVFQEPEAMDRGFGGQVVFNIQSLNPKASGEAVIDALNAFAESGGGGFIESTLVGNSQGKSGP